MFFRSSLQLNDMYRFTVLFTLIIAALPAHAQQSFYTLKVAKHVQSLLQQGHKVDVVVYLHEQADLSPAKYRQTKEEKSRFVFDRLRQIATQSQTPIIQLCNEHKAYANSFYLVNAVAIENADESILRSLAELQCVKSIFEDPWMQIDLPNQDEAALQSTNTERNTIEWGIEKINAPAVWANGFNGQGVTIGGADTGYDWSHPALKTHYRGYKGIAIDTADHQYNWYDAVKDSSNLNGNALNPCGFSTNAPCDDQSHGTHTMGTMVGDDDAGNQIGVAPGAKWIGCRNMDRGWGRPSTYLGCFEWFLAPTQVNGLNPDPLRAPHVINNSWYCADIEGCDQPGSHEMLRQAIINLKASGVVVVISNGNDGPGCVTTGNPPAYFEESFSIGATNILDTIAGFSSRGPVMIDMSNRIKPNVSAPGANVRSCVPNMGYANFSGTSMAGPHVAGLVALMISANPQLAGQVDTIESMIEATAVPLFDGEDCGGVPNTLIPNNTHGFGRVNALAAVALAQSFQSVSTNEGPSQSFASISPTFISQNCTVTTDQDGQLIIHFFDALGRQIQTTSFLASKGIAYPINLHQHASGPIFYQLTLNDQSSSGKLMKE
jgi:serine protease AprX